MYNAMYLTNAAWTQYMYTVLSFDTFQINGFLISANVMLFAGIMYYKEFCRSMSWRNIYLGTTLLSGVFTFAQFALLFRLHKAWGLPAYVFAMGDDVILEFIIGVQFLPMCIMFVHLCPKGSEGASYAMLTTTSNAAFNMAGTISVMCLGMWNVTKAQLELCHHERHQCGPNTACAPQACDGMWKLSLFTSCMQLAPILFLPLLPAGMSELKKLGMMKGSKIGGAVYLVFTFGSVRGARRRGRASARQLTLAYQVLWTIISSAVWIFTPHGKGHE